MLKAIDLFCGAGGLSIGIARSGFKTLLANDIDPDASRSYKKNHPKVDFIEDNVANIPTQVFKNRIGLAAGELDLLTGGPPCQGFSTVGSKNEKDPRNKLFMQYVRIVEGLLPKFILFENVSGFRRMYEGKAFHAIASELEKLGYVVKCDLLNAVDYGLPQHRVRTIIVAHRAQFSFNFPLKTHSSGQNDLYLKPALTFSDAVSDLPRIMAGEESDTYLTAPANPYQMALRSGQNRLTEHKSPNHGKSLLQVIEHIPPGGCIKDIPIRYRPKSGFGNTYARLWDDRPAPTITRNFGTPSSSRCVHPNLNRGLTTREGARLQSFPDNYALFGSTSSKNLQIGNAVPPLLAEVLGKQIAHFITRKARVRAAAVA